MRMLQSQTSVLFSQGPTVTPHGNCQFHSFSVQIRIQHLIRVKFISIKVAICGCTAKGNVECVHFVLGRMWRNSVVGTNLLSHSASSIYIDDRHLTKKELAQCEWLKATARFPTMVRSYCVKRYAATLKPVRQVGSTTTPAWLLATIFSAMLGSVST